MGKLRALAVLTGLCCLCAFSNAARAASTHHRYSKEVRHALWVDEFHPNLDHPDGVLANGIAPTGADPRPVVDQMEDVLNTPALAAVFAGYIVDPDQTSLTIYVTPGGEAAVTSALSALGSAVAGAYSFVPVSVSWATLLEDEAEIAQNHPTGLDGPDWQVTGFNPSPQTNNIQLDVLGDVADAQSALTAEYPGVPLQALASPDGFATFASNNRYSDGPSRLRGGDAIYAENEVTGRTENCTSGFTMKGNASGEIFSSTAGHCWELDETPSDPTYGQTISDVGLGITTQDGYGLGYVSGNQLVNKLDYQGITCAGNNLNPSPTCTGFVWLDPPGFTGAGTLEQIDGTCDCGSQSLVAADGAATGPVYNLLTQATNRCNYEGPNHTDEVCNLHVLSDSNGSCAQPGDSGGPVFQRGGSSTPYVGTAVGLISSFSSGAGTSLCFATAIGQIQNVANVSVVVGAGSGGPTIADDVSGPLRP